MVSQPDEKKRTGQESDTGTGRYILSTAGSKRKTLLNRFKMQCLRLRQLSHAYNLSRLCEKKHYGRSTSQRQR